MQNVCLYHWVVSVAYNKEIHYYGPALIVTLYHTNVQAQDVNIKLRFQCIFSVCNQKMGSFYICIEDGFWVHRTLKTDVHPWNVKV